MNKSSSYDGNGMSKPTHGSKEMRKSIRERAKTVVEASRAEQAGRPEETRAISQCRRDDERRRQRDYMRERRARLAKQNVDRTPRRWFCAKCGTETLHYVGVAGDLACGACRRAAGTRRREKVKTGNVLLGPCRQCGQDDRRADGRCKPCDRRQRRQKLNAETTAERAARIARLRQNVVRWSERHPDAARTLQRAAKQRRRARHVSAPVVESFSRAAIERIFAETGLRCAYCCRDDAKLTLDHIIPLSMGGEHSDLNLIGACASCNSSKHVRLRPPKLWRSKRQRIFIEIEWLLRR